MSIGLGIKLRKNLTMLFNSNSIVVARIYEFRDYLCWEYLVGNKNQDTGIKTLVFSKNTAIAQPHISLNKNLLVACF
jgi:hypothetical protein